MTRATVVLILTVCPAVVYAADIYVSDYVDSTIVRFDPSGHSSVFANSSSGLSDPTGLAFDRAGNLYVANRATPGTVTKFDSNGHGSVFASGLSIPSGLAVDSHDNIYVATGDHFNSILKYDSTGQASVFASNINGGAE